MNRYPALAALIAFALLGSACASKEDVNTIARRLGHLEDQIVAAHNETVTIQEDLRDHDLRLQFLEYEAVRRGEPIAPRRSMSTPEPMLDADSGRVIYPQAVGPLTPSPASQSPQSSQDSAAPTGPSPVPSATAAATAPAGALPSSPSSSASPSSPGTSPSPGASAQSGQPAQSAQAPATVSDVPRGSQIITEAPDPADPAPTSPQPASSQTSAPGVTADAAPAGTETMVASRAPAQTEQNAYDAALQMYRTGRFPQSEAAFQAFLEVYPDSDLVPNALYWKGETYYARTMFADAIFAFKDVQTRFPQNQKTPDSLLKTAMAYHKLGDTANASLHLAALYEDWPNAEASRRARNMGLRP